MVMCVHMFVSERSCVYICVLVESILPVSIICPLYLETVSTLWYLVFVFHFITLRVFKLECVYICVSERSCVYICVLVNGHVCTYMC